MATMVKVRRTYLRAKKPAREIVWLTIRRLPLAAVGRASHDAGPPTLYLLPMHVEGSRRAGTAQNATPNRALA